MHSCGWGAKTLLQLPRADKLCTVYKLNSFRDNVIILYYAREDLGQMVALLLLGGGVVNVTKWVKQL